MRPFAASLLALAAALAAPAAAQSECTRVDSRQGWQSLSFAGQPGMEVRSIRGGWTVDALNYPPVGAEGHLGSAAERLAPFGKYKAVVGAPFGVLLARSPGGSIYIVREGWRVPDWNLQLRINDSDATLGDNQGSLSVCFSRAAPTPTTTPAAPRFTPDFQGNCGHVGLSPSNPADIARYSVDQLNAAITNYNAYNKWVRCLMDQYDRESNRFNAHFGLVGHETRVVPAAMEADFVVNQRRMDQQRQVILDHQGRDVAQSNAIKARRSTVQDDMRNARPEPRPDRYDDRPRRREGEMSEAQADFYRRMQQQYRDCMDRARTAEEMRRCRN